MALRSPSALREVLGVLGNHKESVVFVVIKGGRESKGSMHHMELRRLGRFPITRSRLPGDFFPSLLLGLVLGPPPRTSLLPVAPAIGIVATVLGLVPGSILSPARGCSILRLRSLRRRPRSTPILPTIGAPILPLSRRSSLALVALLFVNEGLEALEEVKAGLSFSPGDQVLNSFDLVIKVPNALLIFSPERHAEALQTIQEIIATSDHAINRSTHGPRSGQRPSLLTHRRWPPFAQSTLAKQEPQCSPASGSKSAPPRFGPSKAPAIDLDSLEGKEVVKQPTEMLQQRSPCLGPGRPPRRNSSPHLSPAQASPAHPTRGLSQRRLVQIARCPNLPLKAQKKAASSHANHEGVDQKDAPIVHEELEEVKPRVPNPGIQVVVLLKEAVPPVVDPAQVVEGVVSMAIGCGPTAAEDQEEQDREEFALLPGSSSPGAPVGGLLVRPMGIWRL